MKGRAGRGIPLEKQAVARNHALSPFGGRTTESSAGARVEDFAGCVDKWNGCILSRGHAVRPIRR